MKNEKIIKAAATSLAAAFALVTAILLLAGGETDRILLAFGSIVLAMLPMAMEKLFRCSIRLPLYLFALFYALGSMLGHCWYFYYMIPWWDKFLHVSGGVMFAILGVYFFDRMTRGEQKPAVGILFALCFSMAIAALWEFVEFGADRLLGMDMQDDTVITGFTSYLLGETVGVTGSISNIHSVMVNGSRLPVDGYIDIGLIDTMTDMLLESLGALVTCLLLLWDRGRHPLIRPVSEAEKPMKDG